MSKQQQWWKRAQTVIPGGVNSPVRAFRGVGGEPLFFKAGEGAYLIDVDNKRYIDYVASWGPLILGHANPVVVEAVQQTATHGLSFGAPTPLEVELAELICHLMPSIKRVRLINSGTEATMTALRLARAFTKREKIVKFEGCYHGHHDALLTQAGSGVSTLGIPGSAGVPEALVRSTLTVPFNDCEAVTAVFKEHGNDIAAIIVEPIAGNMNCVPGSERFLQTLRKLADEYHSVLIFDEVISGFRVALGGAQAVYDIQPDLTTLGKIIGGGLPVGAVGGREEIMNLLAPLGPVYQAGTLSGNPIAVSAGLATLKELQKPGVYSQLEQLTQQLLAGLEQAAQDANVPLKTRYVGSLFGLFFTDHALPNNNSEVKKGHLELFQMFFHEMLKQGVYFAPSMYEAGFVSLAHTEQEITKTIEASEKVFSRML